MGAKKQTASAGKPDAPAEEKAPSYKQTALFGTDARAKAIQYAEILNTERLLKERKAALAADLELIQLTMGVPKAVIDDLPPGYKPINLTYVPPAPRPPKLNLVKLMTTYSLTGTQIEAVSDPQEPIKGYVKVSGGERDPNAPETQPQ